MSDIRLTTPDGYFEQSLERTLGSVRRIGRRRKIILRSCAALVLVLGAYYSIHTVNRIKSEKEYLALQAEMARLDVFMEINQKNI